MKRLLAAVLFLSLFLTPAFGQDAKQPAKEDVILKKLEELQKSIDSINSSMRKDVEKNKTDINDLKAEVKQLKADLAAARAVKVPQRDDSDIREEIKQLRADIEALRLRMSSSSFTPAKKPPRVEITREPLKKIGIVEYDDDRAVSSKVNYYYNPPQLQYGKVRFVNTYHLSYVCDVNGERKKVGPGETVTFDYIMPGTFTYQVFGVTDLRTRTLSPKETFTVTIHPQPQDTKSYGSVAYYHQPQSYSYYQPQSYSYQQPAYYYSSPPLVYGCGGR